MEVPSGYTSDEWETLDETTKERIRSDGENVSREVDVEVPDVQKIKRHHETRKRWSASGYP